MHPLTSALHLASNAMPLVAQTTSLPCAGRGTGDQGSLITLHAEVNKTPRDVPVDTEVDILAGSLAYNHATTTAKDIALPTAQAIAHHPPVSLTHHQQTPIGIPRTLLRTYSLTVL